MESQKKTTDLLVAYDGDFVGFGLSESDNLDLLGAGPDGKVEGGGGLEVLDPNGYYAEFAAQLGQFVQDHPNIRDIVGAVVINMNLPDETCDCGDDGEDEPADGDDEPAEDSCDSCCGGGDTESKEEDDQSQAVGDMDETSLEEYTFSLTEVADADTDILQYTTADTDPAIGQ